MIDFSSSCGCFFLKELNSWSQCFFALYWHRRASITEILSILPIRIAEEILILRERHTADSAFMPSLWMGLGRLELTNKTLGIWHSRNARKMRWWLQHGNLVFAWWNGCSEKVLQSNATLQFYMIDAEMARKDGNPTKIRMARLDHLCSLELGKSVEKSWVTWISMDGTGSTHAWK